MVSLSPALYPVAGLPAWPEVLNRINPLTYAVDPTPPGVQSSLDVCRHRLKLATCAG